MTQEQKQVKEDIARAVSHAIDRMGLERFKQTSFFISNWRQVEEDLKQAA
jgi:beta-xylosidase